ncbi:MAG: hypothetical protein AAFZ65_04790 [Planctomycetota bacterium]
MLGLLFRLPLRLLLWPLAARWRFVTTLVVLLGGAGWWQFGDELLRLLGLGRPPERQVEFRLRGTGEGLDPARRAALEEQYAEASVVELEAALEHVSDRFDAARDAAFEAVRTRGDVRSEAFARSGVVPSEPEGELLTRVVLDPAEAPGSQPVAWTLTLEREEWPEVYALEAEREWLLVRLDRAREERLPDGPAPLLEADG